MAFCLEAPPLVLLQPGAHSWQAQMPLPDGPPPCQPHFPPEPRVLAPAGAPGNLPLVSIHGPRLQEEKPWGWPCPLPSGSLVAPLHPHPDGLAFTAQVARGTLPGRCPPVT